MAITRHLGLGVLETRWFDERHHTVRPLFEFLSYALKDRPDAFTYERFVGAVSFREAVRFLMTGGDIEYLYVAAHGDFGKIEAPYGAGLSRTFLRNTINEVNRRRRRLKGILFGSCKFGDAYNLIELLRPSKIRGETVPEPAGLGGRLRPGDRVHAELALRHLFLRPLLPHDRARARWRGSRRRSPT